MSEYIVVQPQLGEKSLYQRVIDSGVDLMDNAALTLKESIANPISRRGVLAAGSLVAIVTLPGCGAEVQDIAQEVEEYGILDGFGDGLKLPLNTILKLFTDWGWVADDTGVYSSPSTAGYKLTYGLGACVSIPVVVYAVGDAFMQTAKMMDKARTKPKDDPDS
tara:strand:- start:314 stop:802 length:489 start_codon:yes stop_codon:yes gene_type:complete